MAIRKTGSRKIVVDGEAYLWRVRQKPTYSQGIEDVFWKTGNGFAVAIQHADGTGTTLVARFRRPRPDNWLGQKSQPVLPNEIAEAIRRAIEQGWQPRLKGKQFRFNVEEVTEEEK